MCGPVALQLTVTNAAYYNGSCSKSSLREGENVQVSVETVWDVLIQQYVTVCNRCLYYFFLPALKGWMTETPLCIIHDTIQQQHKLYSNLNEGFIVLVCSF